jgi:peptidoglycan/LPS O-acetylase OafA/YrhL
LNNSTAAVRNACRDVTGPGRSSGGSRSLDVFGLVLTGFAYAGHWHDALKGLWACLLCGGAFCVVAVVAQIVNPFAFIQPVSVWDNRDRFRGREIYHGFRRRIR